MRCKFFTDRSGIHDIIGAAATTKHGNGRRTTIQMRLEKKRHHTIYKAHLFGIILVTCLGGKKHESKPQIIYTDSQAATKALTNSTNHNHTSPNISSAQSNDYTKNTKLTIEIR